MKKENKPMTPKETASVSLDKEIEDCKRGGEPTYRFEVGDKVRVGALIDCVVDEVREDGFLYGIACKRRDRKNLCDDYIWTPWYNVRPIIPPSEQVFTNEKAEKLWFLNTTVESLISRALHAGVDFEPEYQRGRVWSEEDQAMLLASVFMKADIGKFVFRVREIEKVVVDDISYEIVDGKQRLLTLLDFYLNRFPYKGVYFNELNPIDRRTFLDCGVAIAELQECSRTTVLEVFLRLNRGGRPVSEEIIKKAQKMLDEENKKI